MSQYREIEHFPKAWIFRREDPKVTAEDFAQIRLLSETAAANIWRDYISSDHLYPELLDGDHWLTTQACARCGWEARWESDDSVLPEEIIEHLQNWGDDTTVWFCCHSDLCFETTWGVFQRTWKAFLFLDTGPVLLGRKKKQAVQFYSDGTANLSLRG
ncbi:DUF2947 family protein [Maribrevibacterium harenarium]|uniref:DUF2947 family protein n=1 Tax=Maribrevibacterium harenarium TaxID=2589817 RepID=A0A501WK20_9GAMM|nr:DUF2947 family protein [Maribrevibacterium harenarium]TPE48444.1 DUF2947 family protein [Maribrevibacterium harenarium]